MYLPVVQYLNQGAKQTQCVSCWACEEPSCMGEIHPRETWELFKRGLQRKANIMQDYWMYLSEVGVMTKMKITIRCSGHGQRTNGAAAAMTDTVMTAAESITTTTATKTKKWHHYQQPTKFKPHQQAKINHLLSLLYKHQFLGSDSNWCQLTWKVLLLWLTKPCTLPLWGHLQPQTW